MKKWLAGFLVVASCGLAAAGYHRLSSIAVAGAYGWDYAVVDVLSPADQVSTLGAPAIQIAVGDLLP